MRRRDVMVGGAYVAAAAALGSGSACSHASARSTFMRELESATLDLRELEKAKDEAALERELGARGQRASSYTSSLGISDEARSLLIFFEVSSAAAYRSRYFKPYVPGGSSGVTIGIGYDLGQTDEIEFRAAWDGILESEVLEQLGAAIGKRGAEAELVLPQLEGVEVSWEKASAQFDRYLPSAIGLTEFAFPNCSMLSPSSLGSLVSLVYNRGAFRIQGTNVPDSRREMSEIHALMSAMDFHAIPEKFEAMKRVWEGKPGLRGLLKRRDMEAALFRLGLSEVAQSSEVP